MSYIDYMHHALRWAQKAYDMEEVPVGAVLVLEGKVIAEGWNQPITHHDPSAHAEIVALRSAGLQLANYRLPETTLYVTVEPCMMCLGAMTHARVKRLVFGAPEPRAGAVNSNPLLHQATFLNHKIEVVGGVLADECRTLMQSFFKARRKSKKEF